MSDNRGTGASTVDHGRGDGDGRRDGDRRRDDDRRRDGEGPRAEARAALRAVARGGGVALLTGPPGAGKSALLAELRDTHPGRDGARALLVRPGRRGRLAGYGLLEAMLEADGRGELPAAAAATRTATTGSDVAGPTDRVRANGAADGDAPAQDGPVALGGLPASLDLARHRRDAAERAVDALVELLTEDRLVLVDDGHWADGASLTALVAAVEELTRRGRRPRLVCAGEPEADVLALRPAARALFGLPGAVHVRLPRPARRPTSPDPVREQIRRRLGGDLRLARSLAAAGLLAEAQPTVAAPGVAAVAQIAPVDALADLVRLAELGLLDRADEGWRIADPDQAVDVTGDGDFEVTGRLRAGLWIAEVLPGAPERAARVLLHAPATGNAEVADVLLRAARVALTRGDPDVAGELLRRAGAEPPTGEQRGRLALEQAFVAEASGAHDDAERHAEKALRIVGTPQGRAQAALALSRLQLRHGREMQSLATLEQAADAAAEDGDERLLLEGEIMDVGHGGEHQFAVATRRARHLRDGGLPAGHPVRERAETFLLPFDGTAREVAQRLAPRIERDLAASPDLPPVSALGSAWLLVRSELWETATLVLDAAARASERRGAAGSGVRPPGEQPVLRSLRGLVELSVGDPRRALALAEDAVARLDHPGWTLPVRHTTAVAARVSTACGDPDAAMRALALVEPDLDAPFAPGPSRPSLHIARAEAHLARGDQDRALRDALRAEELKARLGVPNPSGFPWAIVACAVLVARGDVARARTIAAADLRGARRWGAPMALSIAARAMAMSSPPGERERILRAALRRVEPTTLHLERVRVLWALADALYEVGRDTEGGRTRALAREEAVRHGHEVRPGAAGAVLVDPRRRMPAATPGTDAGAVAAARLTPRERDVADLLVLGLTNPAIARRMGLGERTVQTHVGKILRKTGSRTRTEAARKLRGGD